MRMDQLVYFTTVVQCGSINKAAKKLFISQPTLSASIAAFEKEIGEELLKRQKQGVIPTAIGQKVYTDALSILDKVNSWGNSLSENPQEIKENITISTLESASFLFLPSVINSLEQIYPYLTIELYPFLQTINLYKDNIDIIITAFSNNELPPTNDRYQIECIFHDYYVAYISTSNPLAQRTYVTMEELAQNKFIFIPHSGFLKFIDPKYRDNNMLFLSCKEGIMSTVAVNAGVTILPSLRKYNNYYIQSNTIRAVPIIDSCIRFDYYLIYPTKHRISPGQKIVINYLKDSIEQFFATTYEERLQFFSPISIVP